MTWPQSTDVTGTGGWMERPDRIGQRLEQLQERRAAVEWQCHQVRQAAAQGLVTQQEHDFFLQHGFDGLSREQMLERLDREIAALQAVQMPPPSNRRRIGRNTYAVLALALSIAMAVIVLTGSGPPVGLTIVKTVGADFPLTITENTSIPLNASGYTGLRATGTLIGGQARLELVDGVDEERLLIAEATQDRYAVLTEMTSYSTASTITATVLPEGAEATLWLIDKDGGRTPVATPFPVPAPGEYKLEALINDTDGGAAPQGIIEKRAVMFTVREDANPTNDVPRGPRTVTFTDACVATCATPLTDTMRVEITVSDGAQLTLEELRTTTGENRPPALVSPFLHVTMAEGETVTIDLTDHFVDHDGDTLTFDVNNAIGVTEDVQEGLLTLTGLPGTYEMTVYASDLQALTQASFTLTITPAQEQEMNTTGNTTTGNTMENGTSGTTTNTTNETADGTEETTPEPATTGPSAPNCSDPDPNKRPVDCLLEGPGNYFPDQEIYWERPDRTRVARFTSIGNLLIRGDVVERSSGTPGAEDFRLGYADDDLNIIPTIWIDSATGDLHLRGTLHEENPNLTPPPGSYSFNNRRGITLAYGALRQGDLYLRGNIIPRRDIR